MSYRSAMRIVMAALAIPMVSGPAFGAGFQINEQGAIGTGRAGAMIGTANMPSAVFHNPAGLTRTKGTQFMGGVSLILPEATYVGRGIPSDLRDEAVSQDTETTVAPVPYAYVSHALSKTAYVGFGFYNHYGLRVAWEPPDDFVGRTLVQELSLRTFYLNPVIALKLSDAVSVAVGVTLVPATLSLTRVIGSSDNGQVLFPATANSPEGQFRVEGSAFGVGATAGIQISLIDHLRLGFTYRSAIDLAFEGDGDFTLPDGTPASVAASFPDQRIAGDLTLPHSFLGGIGWEEDQWTIELAAQVTLWTSYDELTIDFVDDLPVPSTTLPRDWEVSSMFRLGGEYRLDDTPLAIRAGLAYDQTPIPDRTIDPTLPGNDRFMASLGLGYDFGPVRFDTAYMMLFFPEREITPEDGNVNFPTPTPTESYKYESTFVHVISLSLGVEL